MKNRDLERMSEKELKEYLKSLNKTANERIAKLKASNIQLDSTAYRLEVLNRGIRKFTVPKNATESTLKSKIYAVQSFIQSPTSKVENVSQGFERFQQQFGSNVDKASYRRYLRNFYKIQDTIESNGIFLDSEQIVAVIEIVYKTKGGIDNALQQVNEFLVEQGIDFLSDEFIEI